MSTTPESQDRIEEGGHPVIAAVLDALRRKPICGHIPVTSIAQSGRCDSCTAALAAPIVLRWAADHLDDQPFLCVEHNNAMCTSCPIGSDHLRIAANKIEAPATGLTAEPEEKEINNGEV